MEEKQATNHNSISKEFLLEEYGHFAGSFWRNEEVGEKRVNFFITLVTAVIAGLVALATKIKVDVYPLAVFALIGLLFFGIVTLNRMIKRNQVTDEYKLLMNMIRSRFRDWGDRLQNYQPFGKGLLVSIELKFKEHMKSEKLSENLRKELQKNGVSVSKDHRIDRIGSCHLIIDKGKKKRYMIFEEKQGLNIYDGGETRKPRAGGLVTMVVVINSLIVGALVGLVTVWLFHLVRSFKLCAVEFDGFVISGIILGMGLGLVGFFLARRKQERYVEKRYEE